MTSDISKKKKSKKQELQEPLEEVETQQLPPPLPLPLKEELEEPETETEKEIEKPKKIKRIVKPRTEKQIESLAQGRLKRDQQQNERRKIKEQEDIILKQELEKKLIDKAIKVKKKQLKKIEMFDELSDEDTMPQVIQKQKKEKPKTLTSSSNPYDEFKKKYNIH